MDGGLQSAAELQSVSSQRGELTGEVTNNSAVS